MCGLTLLGASDVTDVSSTDCILVLEPYPGGLGLPSEIVHGEVGVPHDLPQESPAERPARVHRHRRSTAISMAEDHVATALTDCDEAMAVKDRKHLLPAQSRQVRAHTATRTLVAPTSW